MHSASIAAVSALCVATLAVTGCGDSQAAPSGITEPLRIANGQFMEGDFPTSHDAGPTIKEFSIANSEFVAGTTGKAIKGLADPGSQSVAFQLQGLGTGYWILPVGAPDPSEQGALSWSATCDFARDLLPGLTSLQIAASGPTGEFGPVALETLNIKSLIPTGHVVASLTWGSNADLDIHLITPSGKELDPKHPNTIASDDTTGQPVAHSGLLDRDSMAGCVPDGLRTENVVWSDNPEVGGYQVRVDMFSACSQPAATFVFSLLVDGTEVLRKTGRLLDIDADGGGPGSGLFVTEFSCERSGTCS